MTSLHVLSFLVRVLVYRDKVINYFFYKTMSNHIAAHRNGVVEFRHNRYSKTELRSDGTGFLIRDPLEASNGLTVDGTIALNSKEVSGFAQDLLTSFDYNEALTKLNVGSLQATQVVGILGHDVNFALRPGEESPISQNSGTGSALHFFGTFYGGGNNNDAVPRRVGRIRGDLLNRDSDFVNAGAPSYWNGSQLLFQTGNSSNDLSYENGGASAGNITRFRITDFRTESIMPFYTPSVNSDNILRLNASSVEFDHQGTNRMFIRGNVVVATNIFPNNQDTQSIGNATARMKEVHAKEVHVKDIHASGISTLPTVNSTSVNCSGAVTAASVNCSGGVTAETIICNGDVTAASVNCSGEVTAEEIICNGDVTADKIFCNSDIYVTNYLSCKGMSVINANLSDVRISNLSVIFQQYFRNLDALVLQIASYLNTINPAPPYTWQTIYQTPASPSDNDPDRSQGFSAMQYSDLVNIYQDDTVNNAAFPLSNLEFKILEFWTVGSQDITGIPRKIAFQITDIEATTMSDASGYVTFEARAILLH